MQTFDDNGGLLTSNLYNLSIELGTPTLDWSTMTLTFPTPNFELPENEICIVERLNGTTWEQSEVMPFMPSNNEGMVIDGCGENQSWTVRLKCLFSGTVSNTAVFNSGTNQNP